MYKKELLLPIKTSGSVVHGAHQHACYLELEVLVVVP